jgi:hypothetical protein
MFVPLFNALSQILLYVRVQMNRAVLALLVHQYNQYSPATSCHIRLHLRPTVSYQMLPLKAIVILHIRPMALADQPGIAHADEQTLSLLWKQTQSFCFGHLTPNLAQRSGSGLDYKCFLSSFLFSPSFPSLSRCILHNMQPRTGESPCEAFALVSNNLLHITMLFACTSSSSLL